jgi:hypothetical protein
LFCCIGKLFEKMNRKQGGRPRCWNFIKRKDIYKGVETRNLQPSWRSWTQRTKKKKETELLIIRKNFTVKLSCQTKLRYLRCIHSLSLKSTLCFEISFPTCYACFTIFKDQAISLFPNVPSCNGDNFHERSDCLADSIICKKGTPMWHWIPIILQYFEAKGQLKNKWKVVSSLWVGHMTQL